MAKKKLTNKEIAKLLREAKIIKSLENLKVENDKKFRAKAESSELLTPSINLNSEIRLKTERKKANAGQIKAQQNKVKSLQVQNKKIKSKREDLELEFPFTDDERKREIEKLLASPDYQLKDLFTQKNILKQLQGKDFDFIVNDGFETYKISSREFKQQFKKGEDATLPILKRTKRNIKKAIVEQKQLTKKSKKTASKVEMKKLNKILYALENKLLFTVEKNIEALETGDESVLDDVNDEGEKAYSTLNKIVGFNIDRISI